jgi:type I restriction enzyme R subunit
MSAEEVIDTYTWRIGQILVNRRALFVLWAVKTLFCTTKADFLRHYKITNAELTPLLEDLTIQGFLQEDGEHYVLTEMGAEAVGYLGELDISQFAQPARLSREVTTRFEPDASLFVTGRKTRFKQAKIAEQFWKDREHDRGKPEATFVELPFIQQLVTLGWEYKPGHLSAPEFTGRRTFREVVIEKALSEALPQINLDEKTGQPWLDEPRIQQMVNHLKRILNTNTPSLLQANKEATELLLKGIPIPGSPQLHNGRTQRVHFIDFVHPERNQFLVINQFRVDLAGTRYIIPDIVLFVNGIPLVVVECKNPALTNPLEQGIRQLLHYARRDSGQGQATIPTALSGSSGDLEESEAMPELFYFNLLLVSTCFFQARFAALGASYEHFQEWKDPYLPEDFRHFRDLLPKEPASQQNLVLGMLLPYNLLDLLYNFTLFESSGNKLRKLVAYYHQFRAVHNATRQLLTQPTRLQHGEEDQRGGIIWHTQGSGKSLTMVFLVRKMRTIEKLKGFKIVFVTDRKQLEKQLRRAALLTEEPIRTTSKTKELEGLLLPQGPKLVFAMIQKYQILKRANLVTPLDEDEDEDAPAAAQDDEADPTTKEVNPRVDILVIVDEAHRSQTRKLHANLRKMLPNCARIAFTGTPIIRGPGKKTYEIFGNYIDQYTIRESELDGATLPIFYEGRETCIEITQSRLLDDKYETLVRPFSHYVRETLQERNVTYRTILEDKQLIEKKAEDMLLHYCEHILPNGFKAMVVAVSRLAAILYRDALEVAQKRIVARLDALPLDQRNLTEEQIESLYVSDTQKTLIRIFPDRDLLNALQFAAIVSPNPKADQQDTRVDWSRWSDEGQHDHYVDEFKKPLPHADVQQGSPLAFLCVRSMLITGFDAPIAQGLYLDRSIKNHELLQAIARVNRLYIAKGNGLVVDYYGIAQNLKDALSAYREADVHGALASIQDEYPLLADRHRRVLAIFEAEHCDLQDRDNCVKLLKDPKRRADFEIKFKKFMESLETVLPRPEALRYIKDAQQLGVINLEAAAVYRDEQLNLINIGNKVRKLINEHIDVLQIRQRISPVSIHDVHFAQKLRRYQSDETNAVEMEGFARDYITYHYAQEDPAYCNTLSMRLQALLDSLRGNWSQTVEALDAFIKAITQPRQIDENLKLDPRTEYPFFGILEEEVRKGSRCFAIPPQTEGSGRELEESEREQLASFTKLMVQVIRQRLSNYNDFWLFPARSDDLRKEIGIMIEDEGLLEPFTRREHIAARLVRLALFHTSRLRDA